MALFNSTVRSVRSSITWAYSWETIRSSMYSVVPMVTVLPDIPAQSMLS